MMPNTLRPMRVALVSSSLRRAGSEKQTTYLARALLEAGADVLFFYLGQGGHYEQVLRQMGIPLFQIYKANRPLFILARLIGSLRRFQPDIVFSPQFGDLLQAGLAGRLSYSLVLGGVRSDGFYELNGHGWRGTWMLQLAHGLIANSHRARQNLASRGADPSKIRILPNVLDLGEFDTRSKTNLPISLPHGRVIAAAVGSLHPCKRFDRFLNVLALARRKAPSLFGVVAGSDCGCRAALERQAQDLGLLPDHALFLRECANVPALLAQVGLLVLCSDYEGFPNVLLEAMAAGLPVVTTCVGDAERIVLQDRTGLIVEGDELEPMAECMAKLALDPSLRRQMGRAGRERLAAEYNYETLAGHMLAVFGEFARRSRKRHVAQCLESWAAVRKTEAGEPVAAGV